MMRCYKRLPEPAINGAFRLRIQASIVATIKPDRTIAGCDEMAMALKLLHEHISEQFALAFY